MSNLTYETDRADYLNTVAQLFGSYKRRNVEFMNLQPGQSVLDVGCGTGDDAVVLKSLVGDAGSVTAVDHDENLVSAARARTKASGVQVLQGDVYALPCKDNQFDHVRADRVFQHLDRPIAALTEMLRVTASGGHITVVDVDWGTLLLDSHRPQVTEAVLNLASAHAANGQAGRQLLGMLNDGGLLDIDVMAETIIFRDAQIANSVLALNVFAEQAGKQGLADPDEASQWLTELNEKSRRGSYFASISGFGVRGRKA